MMKDSTYVKDYYQNGLVQHDAALELVELLPVNSSYVLDVGCGSGKVSELFYKKTSPLEMIAIDKSFEMFKEAVSLHKSTKINYKNYNIENISFKKKFDVIISNSSLQWFKNIKTSLSNIQAHLSDNGRFYVQAPFRQNWCPEITLMIDDFFDENYPELKNHFSFPCLHLETLDEYVELFNNANLNTEKIYSKTFSYNVDNSDFIKIFKSGAIKAYSSEENFSILLPQDFYDKLLKFASNYYNERVTINMPRFFAILKQF